MGHRGEGSPPPPTSHMQSKQTPADPVFLSSPHTPVCLTAAPQDQEPAENILHALTLRAQSFHQADTLRPEKSLGRFFKPISGDITAAV